MIFKFMDAQKPQATAVANETGLSANLILAWASYESAWGTSRVAIKNNNYFGLKGQWAGDDPSNTCKVQDFACFASQTQGLEASAVSALSSFGDKYLYAALSAFGDSPQQIVQKIVDAGFNSEYGAGVYAGIVANRVQMVQTREDCPK